MGEAKRRKMSGKYKRKFRHSFFNYTIIYLWVLAAIAFLIGIFLPDEFYTAGSICIKIAFSIIPLSFAWFGGDETPLWSKIVASAMVIPFWLPMISNKIALVAYIICIFISAALWFYFSLVKKLAVIEFRIYLFIFLFHSLIFSSKYTFVNNPKAIHFWQIPLAFSICITIFVAILFIKNKISLKDNSVGEKIAATIMAFVLSFIAIFPIPAHLNYILDFEEREEFWAEIEEKDFNITHTRRTYRTDYYFYFDIDGKEVKMDVSEREYSFYEEGDYYPIRLYSGAFDDPFYFSGNIIGD